MQQVQFFRSSRCSCGECVEVGFVKSSRCDTGSCVEVANYLEEVCLRDSKNPSTVLSFSPNNWQDFLIELV